MSDLSYFMGRIDYNRNQKIKIVKGPERLRSLFLLGPVIFYPPIRLQNCMFICRCYHRGTKLFPTPNTWVFFSPDSYCYFQWP